ncbi:MAG TPA: hypothetical protein PK304_02250 [Mobilitalea sp.]|nr:hypothetical protein [Mobilitalea sp.]
MSCNNSGNASLVQHLYRYIGDTVTIFTTSGGLSGNGFTGVLLSVNNRFVRLLTQMGDAPTHPISGGSETDHGCMPSFGNFALSEGDNLLNSSKKGGGSRLGSICDIPIDRIAAFCHNAV